jgi:solute carrier family 25 S-adenosylmethionine transporter 26
MIIHDAINQAISMACGIIIAETITLPLLPISTIKITYQTTDSVTIPQTIKNVYKKFGYKGFFNAYSSTVLYHVVAATTKFTSYKTIKSIRKTDSKDLLNNSINGMFGGLFGSIFTHPVDVIKNLQHRNINIKQDFKIHGFKGLYRGYSSTIFRTLLSYSFLYPLYDFYKYKFNDSPFVAPIALITSTMIVQPLDFIKTKMIAKQNYNFGLDIPKYYKGISLQLLRNVPRFWISMTFMEKINKSFNNS